MSVPPPSLVSEVRIYVERHKKRLLDTVTADDPTSGGEETGRAHAKMADGLLSSVFAVSRAVSPDDGGEVCLAAVGSYGRGAVALASDLDVRFLVEGAPDDVQALAERVLHPLWDGGLPVGHQVVSTRDVLELARTDLPTATSLLDLRPLGGTTRILADLVDQARAQLFGDGGVGAFVQRLGEEVSARHERFGGSVYLLEPDVRNGAGALRDLDVIGWAANARWGARDTQALVHLGVIVHREALELGLARSLFWRIRNRLHKAAGRRSDRLTFDFQERFAEELGYGQGGAAVERLMSDYYRLARVVSHVQEIVLTRARPQTSRRKPHEEVLSDDLLLFDGQVTFAHPEALDRDPANALRLFREAVVRKRPVFPFAREAVMRKASDPEWAAQLRKSKDAVGLFFELLLHGGETPFGARTAIGELHEVGLVVALVHEFAPVVGRVHHDVYHVYTVDVHSVAAVDRLHALARGDAAEEFPLACRLAADVSRPRVLYLATLLHDVGKDIGGKNHAERGAQMVENEIGPRLLLSPQETADVAHLVRVHLSMYQKATRRDVDDPATIEDFLGDVRGTEQLRELFLLTVADLSTTSPTALTSWKSKLLEELYRASERVLSGSSKDANVEEIREETVRRLGATPAAREHLAALPTRYLLSNDPSSIAWHMEAVAAAERPVARIRKSDHDTHELVVVAPDRPGLLAAIAASIVAARLEVHAAQIHTRRRPDGTIEALDLFWVRGPGADERQIPHTERMIARELGLVLAGKKSAADVAAMRGRASWAERPTPAVETTVSVDDRGSHEHGILEVITRDRPGVLFALASSISDLGLSISLAKINTEGTRVADVFYVTAADGTKVPLRGDLERIRGEVERRLAAL